MNFSICEHLIQIARRRPSDELSQPETPPTKFEKPDIDQNSGRFPYWTSLSLRCLHMEIREAKEMAIDEATDLQIGNGIDVGISMEIEISAESDEEIAKVIEKAIEEAIEEAIEG